MNTAAGTFVPETTSCDREPITRLETIQGFGFLLALSEDWTVARASANLEAMLGMDAGRAIGMPLAGLIVEQALHDIRNRIVILRAHHSTERMFGVRLLDGPAKFDIALHYTGELLIVEGEPSGDTGGADAASLVRTMVARLNTMETLENFHRDCARQVRALTGFDRVMVYRFGDGGFGEVIAESVNGSMKSFLGLRYPAADIPQQARALYLRNRFRIIGDVEGQTVALLPPASDTVAPLDLSLAITRAVSPIHIEYLSNMGIAASLSISIVVEGRLWGLLICHHQAARVPHFVKRTASELFTQMYSMILENRIRQANAIEEIESRRLADRMISAIAGDRRLLDDAAWMHGTLREMIACDGVAILLNGRIVASGSTPPPADIDAIARALGTVAGGQVFSTDRLALLNPDAIAPTAEAAGALSIPISLAPSDYILLFRREQVQDVRWGGNPDEAKFDDRAGTRIQPRENFDAFSVLTRGESEPFSDKARRTARIIRAALIDVVFKQHGDDSDERRRTTQRQEVLVAELNHRVRNILALIRGLINQTVTGEGDVASYVQSLNGRVQALARAHDQVTRQNWGPGLLSSLFEHEIGAYVPDQPHRFRIAGPDVHLVPQAFSTMALVIHELVTNSLKYGALSDSGRVAVDVRRGSDEGLHIHWREVDGPQVRLPTRRGFGSAIVERTIPFDLQGTADIRYPTTGMEADFFVPAQYIWDDANGTIAPPSPPQVAHDGSPEALSEPLSQPLARMRVLLLEDNMIVALETEDLLRALGAVAVHTVSTIRAGVNTLERETIDFAVLDINVGNESSLDFATRCRESGIPFVFASGYGSHIDLGPQHRNATVVHKPYLLEDVRGAVGVALAGHAAEARMARPGAHTVPP